MDIINFDKYINGENKQKIHHYLLSNKTSLSLHDSWVNWIRKYKFSFKHDSKMDEL